MFTPSFLNLQLQALEAPIYTMPTRLQPWHSAPVNARQSGLLPRTQAMELSYRHETSTCTPFWETDTRTFLEKQQARIIIPKKLSGRESVISDHSALEVRLNLSTTSRGRTWAIALKRGFVYIPQFSGFRAS